MVQCLGRHYTPLLTNTSLDGRRSMEGKHRGGDCSAWACISLLLHLSRLIFLR